MPTHESQLRYLSCVGDELGMADLSTRELHQMSEWISCLEADFVLVDVGSGSSYRTLDFFNLGDDPIVVAAPDQVSMQCAYAFIRNSIYRSVQKAYGSHEAVAAALRQMRQGANGTNSRTMSDFYDLVRPAGKELADGIAALVASHETLLLVNLAASEQDQRMAEIIQSAARKFLNINMRCCGLIQMDSAARRAPQRASRLDLDDPDGTPARQIRRVAMELAERSSGPEPPGVGTTGSQSAAAPTTGFNYNLTIMGKDVHIQTEDMGSPGCLITTQVFCEGRVILSTKSEYASTLRDRPRSKQVSELMRAQHFNVIREIEDRKTRFESSQA